MYCFKSLMFLAEVSTKLQKMHFFFNNLRTVTHEGSIATKQMTHFYLFFLLSVTFIFIFENGQNSFSCGPLFGLLWSVKYLNFEQKLPIKTAHHIFLERRHPEVTKNPHYVLSSRGSQKRVSANGLIPVY